MNGFKNISLLLVIVAMLFVEKSEQFCSNFPIYPGPDGFPSLPLKYQARIEVNSVYEKRTSDLRVFYDFASNRAAIQIAEKNSFKKLIFNYDTNEIYSLTCTKKTLQLYRIKKKI
jgi:hypothetical protein